ncbi:Optic atrophy 3-like protein [Armadillidium nasatum]|uniref:Optic atrophy 3-like protein n=1 Tax=Armadillidium nasatum TaxID=96803 RepID=A0A5N5TC01_9CRUS|nr:Optic atrophy 3-like protein [Armadillidium nasatum]
MPAFPIAKLVGIVVKQMGKPLANFAKERAKSNHFFRTYICMPPAQFYHWCEVRMKMYVMNIGRTGENSTIPKLNEQAAIELGSSLLGEGVIFAIAVGALAYEYGRQKSNEKSKEKAEQDFLTDLEAKVNELVITNERLETKMRELTRLVHYYDYAKLNKIKNTKKVSEIQSEFTSVWCY